MTPGVVGVLRGVVGGSTWPSLFFAAAAGDRVVRMYERAQTIRMNRLLVDRLGAASEASQVGERCLCGMPVRAAPGGGVRYEAYGSRAGYEAARRG